jgi:hypothetical protein
VFDRSALTAAAFLFKTFLAGTVIPDGRKRHRAAPEPPQGGARSVTSIST